MNAWRQDDTRAEPEFCGRELDEAVQDRISEMSYAELRDRCDTYRAFKRFYSHGPFSFRFGEWLRDQVAQELRGFRSTSQFIAQDVQPILDRYVRRAA